MTRVDDVVELLRDNDGRNNQDNCPEATGPFGAEITSLAWRFISVPNDGKRFCGEFDWFDHVTSTQLSGVGEHLKGAEGPRVPL